MIPLLNAIHPLYYKHQCDEKSFAGLSWLFPHPDSPASVHPRNETAVTVSEILP